VNAEHTHQLNVNKQQHHSVLCTAFLIAFGLAAAAGDKMMCDNNTVV
jgi:hypothetical protein